MTWFKVDDHLHSHRKAARAGRDAMGLWVLAGSWSAAEESDGWVPEYMLSRVGGPGAEEAAERLVTAGLWHAETVDGEDGFRFHAWDDFQPTKTQLEGKRAEARDRMRRARSQGGDVRANSEGTSQSVTPTPTRPDPTRPKDSPRSRAAAAAASADFDRFWSLFPRKVGRAAAERKFATVTKTTDPAVIAAGLHRAIAQWRANGTEEQFIPHPATWLNQGRWADETSPTAEAAAAPLTSRQCPDTEPHERHRWEHGRNRHACAGVEVP